MTPKKRRAALWRLQDSSHIQDGGQLDRTHPPDLDADGWGHGRAAIFDALPARKTWYGILINYSGYDVQYSWTYQFIYLPTHQFWTLIINLIQTLHQPAICRGSGTEEEETRDQQAGARPRHAPCEISQPINFLSTTRLALYPTPSNKRFGHV